MRSCRTLLGIRCSGFEELLLFYVRRARVMRMALPMIFVLDILLPFPSLFFSSCTGVGMVFMYNIQTSV